MLEEEHKFTEPEKSVLMVMRRETTLGERVELLKLELNVRDIDRMCKPYNLCCSWLENGVLLRGRLHRANCTIPKEMKGEAVSRFY